MVNWLISQSLKIETYLRIFFFRYCDVFSFAEHKYATIKWFVIILIGQLAN